MSDPEVDEKIGQLAALLCDGELTPEQSAKLEALVLESDEACEYLVRYLQLHGELHWQLRWPAFSQGRVTRAIPPAISEPPEPTVHARPSSSVRSKRTRRYVWTAMAAAATVFVIVGGLAVLLLRGRIVRTPGDGAIARLERTYEAYLVGTQVSEGSELAVSDWIELREGLAEVVFASGARVILEGPAMFQVNSLKKGLLISGRLAAEVPRLASGFTVATPDATVVDRGTEFGIVASEVSGSEVHVFGGKVEVTGVDEDVDAVKQNVLPNQAVEVTRSPSGKPQFRRIESAGDRFVRSLPSAGSVTRFRQTVARHPALLHHYTFEGDSRAVRLRDKRGGLDLDPVSTHLGEGRGYLYELAPGFDAVDNAIRPFGAGLQSRSAFNPPNAMTVELLLRVDDLEKAENGPMGVAVATQALENQWHLFLAVGSDGQLTYLATGSSPQRSAETTLVPKDWHYLAATFSTDGVKTTVNSYLANVSRGDGGLQWAVENVVVEGVLGSGLLGVGMGFDQSNRNAFSWPGLLDEVAIYSEVLSTTTLNKHLRSLFEQSAPLDG